MKAKIKTIVPGQDKEWNGKVLRKRIIVFEDESNGELTLFPDNPEPEIGQELDFEFQDRGYGKEIKINRPGGRSGGGFKKSPKREAMIDTLSVLKSCLESSQLEPKHIKGFIENYHPFFMEFMAEDVQTNTVQTDIQEIVKDVDLTEGTDDDLPF